MNYLTKPMTSKQSLILSETDYYRLYSTIDHEKRMGKMSRKRLNQFRNLLRNVSFYPTRLFPEDVITMNSVVELRIVANGSVWIVRLAYPHEANKEQLRVSVFSILGMNLLGRRTGESVRSGRLRIGKILYQPEGFNHFHL